MSDPTSVATDARLVSRPLDKLDVLFAESGRIGAGVGNQRQLAIALQIVPSALQEWCGPAFRKDGGRPKPALLGRIAQLYTARGIPLEPEWFYWDLGLFTDAVHDARLESPPNPFQHDIVPSLSTNDWIVADATHVSQGLAALLIHPPPPSNDPNTFQLRVSLSLAVYPDEIDDQPILLGLKQAQIVPVYTACVPAERPAFPDRLKPSGLNDTVLGPRSPENLLDGVVLDNALLASMNYGRGDQPTVTLELHSRRSDLEVLQDDATRAISTNKQRAVQLLLQTCLIENKQGRVVWSHGRLQRRAHDETDG